MIFDLKKRFSLENSKSVCLRWKGFTKIRLNFFPCVFLCFGFYDIPYLTYLMFHIKSLEVFRNTTVSKEFNYGLKTKVGFENNKFCFLEQH